MDAGRLPSGGFTITVGDIHGQLESFRGLWSRLEARLGDEALGAAQVIFLGDYVDRGPQSAQVLDELIALKARRAEGSTHFLAGNHDFAFAAFLGCVDWSGCSTELDLDGTRSPDYVEGFWPHQVEGGMHYQGRRWGGGDGQDIYEANATFASYSVDYSTTAEAREELLDAVPQSHLDFLRDLSWVHTTPLPGPPCRLIAVHAGLHSASPLQPQMDALERRDASSPALQVQNWGRIEAFSGRREVESMHPELRGLALLVSGHHGWLSVEGDRIICDTSGGYAHRALEAIVFGPDGSRVIISTGEPPARMAEDTAGKEAGVQRVRKRPKAALAKSTLPVAAAGGWQAGRGSELEPVLWPKDKLVLQEAVAMAASTTAGSKHAVLVMTGALNPLHTGHVASLESAKRALEAEGWSVVGGWLSPSHKSYVRPKMLEAGGHYLPTEVRLRCVELAVADSDWIMAAAWESMGPHATWPDFPVVVANLKQDLRDSGRGEVTVFFCCGYDHYQKCGLRRGLCGGAGLAVLPRDGESIAGLSAPRSSGGGGGGPIVGVGIADAPPDVSSTIIRKGLKKKGGGAVLVAKGLLHAAVAQYLEEEEDARCARARARS